MQFINITLLSAILLLVALWILWKRPGWYAYGNHHHYRDVILNLDTLEQHAREMASKYGHVRKQKPMTRWQPRLEVDRKFLIHAYKMINENLKSGEAILPASEWLLDNFYVIEEQIKEIQQNLPEHFFKEIPSLSSGPFRHYPRAYAMAVEMAAHTDGRIDEATLRRFIKAFQSETSLTSGELWAIPSMLRIALVKNIRNIAAHIVDVQEKRIEADIWAERLLAGVSSRSEDELARVIDELEKNMDVLNPPFIERLVQKLRDQGSEASQALQWLDEKLADQDTNSENIILSEHQNQAACQVSMGNCITSLRFLSNLNWSDVFEDLSQVEQTLRMDASGIYPLMDFVSRDYYRHQVEIMAKNLGISEVQIARRALECAQENHLHGQTTDERKMHVGYYLVDQGRKELEEKIGYKLKGMARIGEWVKNHSPKIYFISIAVLILLIETLFVVYTLNRVENIASGLGFLILVILSTFIPIMSIVLGMVNWIVTHTHRPCFLPKLELKEGIPARYKTMVVIPTLLTSEKRAAELIEQMEVFYLANQEEHLHFALLGDFIDSDRQEKDDDEKIIRTAVRGIEELNKRYGNGERDLFYYFHRPRMWNPTQCRWMGWERKRGALIELNRLLRANDQGFNVKVGDPTELANIQYVITLDADTQLPRDAAKRLIGTIAHPLNRPELNEEGNRVVEGYGVLQPRMGITVTSASRSLFSLIFSGQTGIDPYTTAISDIYQDLFCEGIFTGKGIYDVDIFIHVLDGKIPENAVLSHDLLEGSYARAGLVTDIELVDGYPSQYYAYATRLHRWVRGDWQLLPWLGRTTRDTKGDRIVNPLTAIDKWKMIDNMRRSLLSPAILLLLILGLVVLPGSKWPWLGLAVISIAFPYILDILGVLIWDGKTGIFKGKFNDLMYGTRNGLWQMILSFIFLPHQAILMIDAITRTLIRIYLTRKHLLEWVTAADAERKFEGRIKDFWHKMWQASAFALLFFFAVLSVPRMGWISLCFALVWFFSPQVAYIISKPYRRRTLSLEESQIDVLRLLSRKTWRYFEDFITSWDNWLAPDNYQEDPHKGVARRTSPTNIGLALMANLAAKDLGFLGLTEMVERIENTLTGIENLEKWKGHLYNWYDTASMKPLHPLYVSSVDSGNLVGYLITLQQGMQEFIKKPLVDEGMIRGLKDTFILAREEAEKHPEGNKEMKLIKEYLNRVGDILTPLSGKETDLVEWRKALKKMQDEAAQGGAALQSGIKGSWSFKLQHMIDAYEREIEELLPWVDVLSQAPAIFRRGEKVPEQLVGKLGGFGKELTERCSLMGMVEEYNGILDKLSELMVSLAHTVHKENSYPDIMKWLKELEMSLAKSHMVAKRRIGQIMGLGQRIALLVENADFTYLYDESRELFSIGYNAEEGRLDPSYYDLLASEARQTSFIAIAKGDIHQKHWFRLNRSLTLVGDQRVLLSWSGTMFEYLMPLLIMRNYEYTLLDETYLSVIEAQKQYGEQKHVPWGVSESGYYAFDISLNYQYKAFGIPRIGLKRGLIRDTVIAPYATILALQVDPSAAYTNIETLMQEGMAGTYGLYEAIDYTPERLPHKRKSAIVKSYMVHHQGMSLLALDNYLHDNIMQNRFHSVPIVRATELLLQERIPNRNTIIKEYDEAAPNPEALKYQEIRANRTFTTPNTPKPETHLLSNGTYSLMLTNSGSGYSQSQGIAITRWREDPSLDPWGMFFYIQNLNSGEVWSVAYQPIKIMPEEYHVSFDSDRVVYVRKDGNIETKTEIVVSPEHNAEIRRISLTNHSEHTRILELTSYSELVLAAPMADLAHPAFSKLFIQTEYLPEYDTLLASRRPRTPEDKNLWVMHSLITEATVLGGIQYETDRARFIGRGRSLSLPAAMDGEIPLSNSVGAVLDPIMSLRRRVRIAPGETAHFSFIMATAPSRHEMIDLAREYRNVNVAARAFELAWTHSQVELRYLNMKANQANLYQRMASHILYFSPLRRQNAEWIMQNRKGQPGLWAYGISGDLPIVLLRVSDIRHTDMVRQILTAHEYWRLKGLSVDLIILNEYGTSYEQPLQERLWDLITMSHARDLRDRPGGVFLRQTDEIPEEDRHLLFSVARLILSGEGGALINQLEDKEEEKPLPEALALKAPDREDENPVIRYPIEEDVIFFNGIGGFSKDGKEYIIRLQPGQSTPMPWVNIVANPFFGFLASETGGGYTWYQNSRENKITPWSNDPVLDTAGEVLYIRDEDSGALWSITPEPIRQEIDYVIRHGQGYSVYQQHSHGLEQRLTLSVPLQHPVKFYDISLRNDTGIARNLSITLYAEWVLGVNRQHNAPYVVTSIDQDSCTLLAGNVYNEEFGSAMAFMHAPSGYPISYTGDRTEFLGRNGKQDEPEALKRKELSGNVGAGYDPCGAIQIKVTLEPGEERIFPFLLGQVDEKESLYTLLNQFPDAKSVEKSMEEAREFWNKSLEVIQVSTPDRSMDFVLNRWFLYQSWACRLWARTGFYQAGGAYGFRDQLQDSLAVVFSDPETTRAQIIRSAAHQFVEGDVQHWWHPPLRGVRTRITDDLLFLPYLVSDYIEITDDWSILDEKVPFLESEPLEPGQEDRYDVPRVSEEQGTIYEHCIRSFERAMRFGEHGLPLMGSGDWNDGMNSVGDQGKGESVWLGWFLYVNLKRFEPICLKMLDHERAGRYAEAAKKLLDSIEQNGWDGGWYRRAYFDDGTPLGSEENVECRIDSISQSWAVISGAAKPSRTRSAMVALENHLIHKDHGLIQLLHPPFDRSDLEPGYIKGYVPGVRENGGQYSHAAAWTVMAFAMMGDGNKAWELFNMLNPINHTLTWAGTQRYKGEPYVMAADVYTVHPHTGRGGWTWYTGSSSWMYRIGIEWILGIKKKGEKLLIDPCIPGMWKEYTIIYRYGSSRYNIKVENPKAVNKGVDSLYLDGQLMEAGFIPLADDGTDHQVKVIMG